jgi:eukaryotic-like serine/threonine-protein kinase
VPIEVYETRRVGGESETEEVLADRMTVHIVPSFLVVGLVAYVSEETGRPEVSIQRIDGTPSRDVISVGGGDQPVWGRNGRELFFVDPQGALRSVPVARGPNGRPVFGTAALLDVPPIGFGHSSTQYDVTPDGRRIYFFDRRLEPAPTEVGVVLGWRALLN